MLIGAADLILLNITATFAGNGLDAHTLIKLGHFHNISLSTMGSEGKKDRMQMD